MGVESLAHVALVTNQLLGPRALERCASVTTCASMSSSGSVKLELLYDVQLWRLFDCPTGAVGTDPT